FRTTTYPTRTTCQNRDAGTPTEQRSTVDGTCLCSVLMVARVRVRAGRVWAHPAHGSARPIFDRSGGFHSRPRTFIPALGGYRYARRRLRVQRECLPCGRRPIKTGRGH